jgi:hypothetical protein
LQIAMKRGDLIPDLERVGQGSEQLSDGKPDLRGAGD